MENEEHFYYFGFASNLKTSLLEDKIGNSVQDAVPGRLVDYGFRFNKQNEDGTARANLTFSEEEDVYGVVYQIGKSKHDVLFQTESGFRLMEVTVETDRGNIEAITFISDANIEDIYPSEEYLQTILEGAKEHDLPEEYIDFIKCLALKD